MSTKDELDGVTKEMWKAAEKALTLTDEQWGKRKKIFENLLLYGTSEPGNVSFDCPFCKNETKNT